MRKMVIGETSKKNLHLNRLFGPSRTHYPLSPLEKF